MAWVIKNKKTGKYVDKNGWHTIYIEFAQITPDFAKDEIVFNPETHDLVEIEIKEKE